MAFHGVGEDEEVVAVAAHARRKVIEAEEVIQPGRILLIELQRLDEGQLFFDE